MSANHPGEALYYEALYYEALSGYTDTHGLESYNDVRDVTFTLIYEDGRTRVIDNFYGWDYKVNPVGTRTGWLMERGSERLQMRRGPRQWNWNKFMDLTGLERVEITSIIEDDD